MSSPAKQLLLGAGLVAATYAYFLLFAQFAFLDIAVIRLGPGTNLQLVLACQGIGGIAGSVLAAIVFRAERATALMAGGFFLAGSAAAIAPESSTLVSLAVAAAATGISVGVVTVTLAARLRDLVGAERLGLAAGLGTGVAYAACSLPALFAAPPEHQSFFAAGFAFAGALIAALGGGLRASTPSPRPGRRESFAWFTVFAALVTVDSAVFYILQHSPALKVATWSGELRQFGVALVHIVGAGVAGWMLDRGRARLVPAIALGGIGVACLLLLFAPAGWNSILYAGAVSFYSTALVHHAARRGDAPYAAAFYIVCGWVASGIGLGVAQGRDDISPGLWIPLLVVAAIGLAGSRPHVT